MKTNAIKKREELFVHGSHLKYIALTVLAAAAAQALIILAFFLLNRIDL